MSKFKGSSSVYSSKLAPDVQAVAISMRGKGKVFRTAYFSLGEGIGREWLQAVKDEKTELWSIYRVTETTDLGVYNEPVLRAISFFDALHYCGSEEMMRGMDNDDALEEEQTDIPHYTKAADESDVPLSKDGLPLVVNDGVILSEGQHDENTKAVAARTKGKALVFVDPRLNMGAHVDALLRLQDARANGTYVDQEIAQRKYDLVLSQEAAIRKEIFVDAATPLHEAFDAARNLCRVLRAHGEQVDEVERNVKASVAVGSLTGVALTSTILLAGLGPLFLPFLVIPGAYGSATLFDKWQRSSDRQFKTNSEKLDKLIAGMPEGEARTMLEDFSRAAKGGYYLEAAARTFRDIQDVDGAKPKILLEMEAQGSAYVNKAVEVAHWLESDAVRLENEFKRGSFPKPGAFAERVEDHYKQVHAILQKAQDEMKGKILPTQKQPAQLPPGPSPS